MNVTQILSHTPFSPPIMYSFKENIQKKFADKKSAQKLRFTMILLFLQTVIPPKRPRRDILLCHRAVYRFLNANQVSTSKSETYLTAYFGTVKLQALGNKKSLVLFFAQSAIGLNKAVQVVGSTIQNGRVDQCQLEKEYYLGAYKGYISLLNQYYTRQKIEKQI